MITNKTIPIFIVSYNRLAYLRTLVERLESLQFENLVIMDNASTFEPLVEYLDVSPHRVVRMQENFGHLALWRSGQFQNVIDKQPFILTDCDVVPAQDCPAPITEYLAELLERYPRHAKAGLSLRICDLPDHYGFKQQVIEWEKPFWEHRLEDGNYEAAIDTTFALYRPGISCDDPRWWRSIRAAPPYSAQHLPWYQDTSSPSDEELYYQGKVASISSQWSITDPVLLKKQNTELQHQIAGLRAEVAMLRAGGTKIDRLTWRQLIKTALLKLGLRPTVQRLRAYMERK